MSYVHTHTHTHSTEYRGSHYSNWRVEKWNRLSLFLVLWVCCPQNISIFYFPLTCTYSLSLFLFHPVSVSFCLSVSRDGVALDLDSGLNSALSPVISRVKRQRDLQLFSTDTQLVFFTLVGLLVFFSFSIRALGQAKGQTGPAGSTQRHTLSRLF